MGTKIMVLKMGEIVRTLLFALVGIALILLVIYFFVPKDKETAPELSFNPGTYAAKLSFNVGDVDLEVTVSENEIINIELKNFTEAHEVFYPLILPTLEQVSTEVIELQSLEVPLSSENIITGEFLLNAIYSALDQAALSS